MDKQLRLGNGTSAIRVAGSLVPVPVTAQSKACVGGRSLDGIVGSNIAGGMDVCCDCCVLSGRGLCVGPVTRLEESYQVFGV